MVSDKLKKDLERIYKKYSKRNGFPRGLCVDASFEVERKMKKSGVIKRNGYFLVDRVMPDSAKNNWHYLVEWHSWCEYNGREIVDLTAHQFNNGLNEPIPTGLLIIKPDNPLFSRYLPGTNNFREYKRQVQLNETL